MILSFLMVSKTIDSPFKSAHTLLIFLYKKQLKFGIAFYLLNDEKHE